jgi:ring-1,2-phenylacetyl-CoA epoxidase subunit PaaD
VTGKHPAGTAPPAGDMVLRADGVAAIAGAVLDPELPFLTIADLGILRGVDVEGDHVVVTVTPTYSGCPALDAIRRDIVDACARHGYGDVEVRTVLSPAWTTDWMTDGAKRTLRDHGIAPPQRRGATGPVVVQLAVCCPLCGSPDTREVSRFGSTPCKALRVCNSCREPFDHVKAI